MILWFLLCFSTSTAAKIFVHDFDMDNNMYTDNPVPVNHHKVPRQAISQEEKHEPYRRVIKIIYSTPAKEIEGKHISLKHIITDIVRHVILGGNLDQFFQPTADDYMPHFRIRKGMVSYEPRRVLTTQRPPEYMAWFDAESKLEDNTETPEEKGKSSPIKKEMLTSSTDEHDATIGSLAFLNDKSNESTIDYWNYLFAIMKTGKEYSKRQINSDKMINFTAVSVLTPFYDDYGEALNNFTVQPLAAPVTPQPISEPISEEVYREKFILPVERNSAVLPYVHFYEKKLNSSLKNPYVPTIPLAFFTLKHSSRWPPVFKEYPIELTIIPVATPEKAENITVEDEPELVRIISDEPENNEIPKFIIPVEQEEDKFQQNAERQKYIAKMYTWLPYAERNSFVSKFSIRKTIGSSKIADIFGEATPLKPPVFFNETLKPPPLIIANVIDAFMNRKSETGTIKTCTQMRNRAHIKLPKVLLYKTARPLVEPPVDSDTNYNEEHKHGLEAYIRARPMTTQDYDAVPEKVRRTKMEYYDTTLETVKEDATRRIFYDDSAYKETQEAKPLKYDKLLEDLKIIKMDELDNILKEIVKISIPSADLPTNITKSLLRKGKSKKTTVKPIPFDIPALMDVIGNLTANWQGDIEEILNKSLANQTVSTCKIPENDTNYNTDYENNLIDEITSNAGLREKDKKGPYANADGVVMGKCFVCGMVETEMPMNSHCSDDFTSGPVQINTIDENVKARIRAYKKICRWRNIPGYEFTKQDPHSMFGRWTGGCSVRWIDISGMYTQRTCRNIYRPAMGRHWASKRMTKLELALRQHVENGCISSPIASLVPLSRAISLYARFHACVCSGNWCNHGSLLQKWSTYIIMLGFTTTAVTFKSLLISL